MPESREIELKFLCEARDLVKVMAAAPAGADETRQPVSVYFDTPESDLRRKGVSLRVRRDRRRHVQTLKRGRGFSREEHEAEVEGDRPDPAATSVRRFLSAAQAATLRPIFEVRVTRRQRLIEADGAVIELAADKGEVRAGSRRAPISEVELELKSGDPAVLFELAASLSRAAPLYLSFGSKAASGEALADTDPKRLRVADLKLDRHADAGEAFQAVARRALAQMSASAAVLRETPTPQAVHQLRVAARQLRSALATFSPLFAKGETEPLKAELKWLAQACGAARNLDVFAEETVAPARAADPKGPGLVALAEVVESARVEARARAAQAAGSERFRRLMIEAVGWIETGAWLRAKRTRRKTPAATFGADRLGRRFRKLRKAGEHLADLDAAGRHQVRIEAKKLRYAAEAFASLFPARAARRFVKRLKRLQDELGRLNDLAAAQPMIDRLRLDPDAAFAAGELLGCGLAAKPRRIARAASALGKLSEGAPFWSP